MPWSKENDWNFDACTSPNIEFHYMIDVKAWKGGNLSIYWFNIRCWRKSTDIHCFRILCIRVEETSNLKEFFHLADVTNTSTPSQFKLSSAKATKCPVSGQLQWASTCFSLSINISTFTWTLFVSLQWPEHFLDEYGKLPVSVRHFYFWHRCYIVTLTIYSFWRILKNVRNI